MEHAKGRQRAVDDELKGGETETEMVTTGDFERACSYAIW